MRVPALLVVCLTLSACTLIPEPAPSASTSTPGPATTAPGGGMQSLAIYYTLAENGNPRLVREFHNVAAQSTSPSAPIRAAVTEMLTTPAVDRDYRNLWPDGARVANVGVSGKTATVDLTNASRNNLGTLASHIAVQQLVWTVTATPGVEEVVLQIDGKPVNELWGHVDVSRPLRRAPAADTLARVWLISPQHGDRVGREVTLHIAGFAFEATVNYEIRRGGTLIKEGFVTLTKAAPEQGEAKEVVSLDPGNYTITAFLVSPEDGSRQAPDDHTVTVG